MAVKKAVLLVYMGVCGAIRMKLRHLGERESHMLTTKGTYKVVENRTHEISARDSDRWLCTGSKYLDDKSPRNNRV
jgi:hypothetical protein